METLDIKRKQEDFYRLQINDTEDYIEFDLTDIGLPERIMIASDNILKLDKEYIKEKEKIEQENKDNEVNLLRESIRLEKEKCLEMRKEFDGFLGEGACQKIFGATNYYGMFLQLFDALEPHFKKMEINIKKGKENLAKKYIDKGKDVL